MSIWNNLKKRLFGSVTEQYKMVTQTQEGFYSFDGRLYKSDLIMACIRPLVSSVGKLTAKHIRESIDKDGNKNIATNPDVYMKFLLEEPNPYMTGQTLQEKTTIHYALNNNAFTLIVRDANGLPYELYPLPAMAATGKIINNELAIQFVFPNGKIKSFAYTDLIHISRDAIDDYIFGNSPTPMLREVMETVTVIDQGIIAAVKNGGIIKWLLKFKQTLHDDDLKKNAKTFAENYLDYETTSSIGVAAVDLKADAERVEPKDYVPNALIQDRITSRVMNFFNVNLKIIQSTANEEEWNAYYEQVIEPVSIKLANEFTRKLFSRKQRSFGNRIYFEAANLEHASLATKLNMKEMVDRGALTPNEWRAGLNLPPVEGGDKPIRRLDTAPVAELKKQIVNDVIATIKNPKSKGGEKQ
jgi:HK97 family phage portal protein